MKKHLSQVHQIINQNDFLEIIINLVTDPPPKHQSLLEPSQTFDTSIENGDLISLSYINLYYISHFRRFKRIVILVTGI